MAVPLSIDALQASQSVQTFSITVDGWSEIRAGLMLTSSPTEALEQHVLQQLPSGATLLRWAVVRIEGDSIICEGAYQLGSSPVAPSFLS